MNRSDFQACLILALSSVGVSMYCSTNFKVFPTLMRTEYFLFTHHTASILANLRTWCFEHSGNISCSLLVNTNHTDESWEGRNTCLWIYALNLFIEHSGEHWWEQNIFCSSTTPQAFWQSSTPGALNTLVTSVVLYSLTQATLKSPEKNETRVCGYIYIYIYMKEQQFSSLRTQKHMIILTKQHV